MDEQVALFNLEFCLQSFQNRVKFEQACKENGAHDYILKNDPDEISRQQYIVCPEVTTVYQLLFKAFQVEIALNVDKVVGYASNAQH